MNKTRLTKILSRVNFFSGFLVSILTIFIYISFQPLIDWIYPTDYYYYTEDAKNEAESIRNSYINPMIENLRKEFLKKCENKNDEIEMSESLEMMKRSFSQSIITNQGIVDAEQIHLWVCNTKTKPIKKLTVSFYGKELDTCLYHYVFPPEISSPNSINYSKANNSIVFTYNNIPPKSKIALEYGFKSIIGIKPKITAYKADESIADGKQIFDANEYRTICSGQEISIPSIIAYITLILLVGFNIYVYRTLLRMRNKIETLIQNSSIQ